MPYDGQRALDAPRCCLKPDFLPRAPVLARPRGRRAVGGADIAHIKPLLPGLESALDNEVSELMINEAGTVFVEPRGRLAALAAPELTTEAEAKAAIQIARPLGEDPKSDPIIDARLADGSRVAVCGPPAAPATTITIRRLGGRAFSIAELIACGSRPEPLVEHASAVLRSGRHVLISGGTGSGKTALLNALVSLLAGRGSRHL